VTTAIASPILGEATK